MQDWEERKADERDEAYEGRYHEYVLSYQTLTSETERRFSAIARLIACGHDRRDIPHGTLSHWSRSSQRELTDMGQSSVSLLGNLTDEL